MRLHTGYSGWWVAIWLTAVVGEIAGFSRAGWTIWLVVFAVVELVAVFRARPGDTWSEHSWWIQGGKMARGLAASWVGVYIAYRFYSITAGEMGALILAAALASWLVPHFYFRGRKG